MAGWKGRWAALAVAAAGACVIAAALDRLAPAPAADVGRGSEEPFSSGLQPREIPPGGVPRRWTGERARVRFRDVPPGPATLDVAVRGHRSAVAVAFDGVLLGAIAPGTTAASYPVVVRDRGPHEAELRVEPFLAGDGRSLGALLQSVRLQHARAPVPSAALLAELALPAAVMALAALLAGWSGPLAAAAGLLCAALEGLLLWPNGVLRSGHAPRLTIVLIAGAVVCAVFSRWCERRRAGAGRWAFAALMAAVAVQGVIASSPVMVVSDAVFHANNLQKVARGDLLLTSMTQHARPFRFPYGVSFYVLLAPLLRAGLDGVALVRIGASAAAVAASGAMFVLLMARSTAARAGLSVLALQLLPLTLDVHSHGNLSNVFAQAATTAFFAWWAGGAPGGWLLGGVLFAAGAMGHFSSLVVLLVLGAALVIVCGRGTLRTRALGLALGAALAAAYYAQFLPLIAAQVPRLLEGGGQGRGASRGFWSALHVQVLAPLVEWGVPVLVLAWLGRPRREAALDRDLVAYWLAGAAMAMIGVVSPLEVRYLYALTIPLAAAAGAGCLVLWSRGTAGRIAAGALLLAQGALAAANALDALLRRYR